MRLVALVILELLPLLLVAHQSTSGRGSCDKTRRVLTHPHGEISDGPAANYTQVSTLASPPQVMQNRFTG